MKLRLINDSLPVAPGINVMEPQPFDGLDIGHKGLYLRQFSLIVDIQIKNGIGTLDHDLSLVLFPQN